MIPGACFASTSRPVAGGGPPSWANAKSLRYDGADTAGSGRTNFYQPSNWSRTLTSQEFTITCWFRRNGRDGALIGSRSSSNGYFWISVGASISCTFGGNFASGGSVTDATWYPLTVTVRNESGTYVGRAYMGSSSTSILNTNAGSDTLAMDFLANARRGSNNTDLAFGAWGLHNIDEIAVWNVGFTGSDHVEWYNSGTPMDATAHSQAAGLISYYWCGDDAGDTTSVLIDTINGDDGDHVNTSNISYPSDVA